MGQCHSVTITVSSRLKIDGCGCVYQLDVNSDRGQPTSHRICSAMSESYKKTHQKQTNKQNRHWLRCQESNGTFVLSTEKSNRHFANSIGLCPMSDMDVHPCNTLLKSLMVQLIVLNKILPTIPLFCQCYSVSQLEELFNISIASAWLKILYVWTD